jgi:hypothetical protein
MPQIGPLSIKHKKAAFCMKIMQKAAFLCFILRGPFLSLRNQYPSLKNFIFLEVHPNVIDATWHIEF